MSTLEVGMKGHFELIVEEAQLACNVGSGLVRVFATPMMIAAIEKTASESVAGALDEGRTSVGININVSHVAATPKGMKVTVETELTEVSANGKILTFNVKAEDEAGLIGEGTHQRAVVAKERFEEKAVAKLNC